MRVLVLHQAVDRSRSDELDTLLQANEIIAHLKALNHDVFCDQAENLSQIEKLVEHYQPEQIFNLVESFYGADRFAYLAAGLLEAMKVPFTGNDAKTLMLASDKLALKVILQQNGIAVPRGLEAGKQARYIIKSVSEHASFGINADSVVNGVTAAQQLVAKKNIQYGGKWIAEEYIEGREFNLALLGTAKGMILLPPAEIIFENFPDHIPHIVDYHAKWDETSYVYNHTPRHFGEPAEIFYPLAKNIWDALGLRGYARIEVRIDNNGKCWVIDINPNPRIASDSGFMAAAAQKGMEPKHVIQTIIESVDCASNNREHCTLQHR